MYVGECDWGSEFSVCMQWPVCGGQRQISVVLTHTALWLPGLELSSGGLVAPYFILYTEFLGQILPLNCSETF